MILCLAQQWLVGALRQFSFAYAEGCENPPHRPPR
jgi:hypothetical protein